MKKLVLLCFLFTYSTLFFAQETMPKTEKKTTKEVEEKTKRKSGYNYDKDVTVKGATKKEVKAKSEIEAKKDAKTKVEANAKKELAKKSNSASEKGMVNSTAGKAKAAENKVEAKLKETNEKPPKVADKITGKYNGKKVYTGPKGGKYYINKNGNKTYIEH